MLLKSELKAARSDLRRFRYASADALWRAKEAIEAAMENPTPELLRAATAAHQRADGEDAQVRSKRGALPAALKKALRF